MVYQASRARYETMTFQRCGNSGLKLPVVSLGCGITLAMKPT